LPFAVLEKLVDKPLRIRGVAMTAGMSRNFNIYTPQELEAFSSKLVNSPVYIEHVAVDSGVGKVTKTDWDGHALWYEAEIYESDVADKIRNGLVQHVSVGADYEAIDLVNGKVPHGLHNAELSLVAVPGIPETNISVLEALAHGAERKVVKAGSCVFCGKPANYLVSSCKSCFDKFPASNPASQDAPSGIESMKEEDLQKLVTEAVEKDYLKKNLKIPIFSAPENAMRAFHLSYQWSSRKPRSLATHEVGPVDRHGAEHLLKDGQKRGHLLLGEALELLKCYGFPMPAYRLARSEEEALQLWHSVQGPVALKIHSPHISHKSDRGAVRLNLNSAADIRKSLLELQSTGGPGTEVLVQSMSKKGREVILGGKQDPTFGPVVLFGLGGIFVELLEDVVWHLAPIGFAEAMQMIQKIKGGKVLQGVRGEAPSDIEATAELLVRLSQLLADYPMIQEIDINPVMVFQRAGGAQALDARVTVRNEP